MKRWSVLVLLAGVGIVLLLAGELLKPQESERMPGVRLTTRTPTVTRTAGWWEQVSTWTPTPTGEGTQTPEGTVEQSTPTPELNLPPFDELRATLVKILVPPTPTGGQP